MQSHNKKKGLPHVAVLGLLLALALVFGYVEYLLPLPFGIPGMKLGLSNLITVLVLYRFGPLEAFIISMSRIGLSFLLFSGGMSFLYSLVGGLFSFAVMAILKRIKLFGLITVSTVGGMTHNLGQLIVALIFIPVKDLLYYLPVLLAAGAVAGFLIGVVGYEVNKRLPGGN